MTDTAIVERAPTRVGALQALRAFTVMSGGPMVLIGLVLVALVVSVVAIVEGRVPPWPALTMLGVAALYVVVVLPWTRRWGATPAERRASLPGDEQVADPGIQMTRAITIDAPPERVWPWLAQIGQDRGGFYSYAWLENLAGCHMRNADRVHPEWQHREIGETVLLHPATGLRLSHFEPNRSYGLEAWYFTLGRTSDGRTRLLARSRIPRGLTSITYALFIELPHFVMERKMLLTLARRARGQA